MWTLLLVCILSAPDVDSHHQFQLEHDPSLKEDNRIKSILSGNYNNSRPLKRSFKIFSFKSKKKTTETPATATYDQTKIIIHEKKSKKNNNIDKKRNETECNIRQLIRTDPVDVLPSFSKCSNHNNDILYKNILKKCSISGFPNVYGAFNEPIIPLYNYQDNYKPFQVLKRDGNQIGRTNELGINKDIEFFPTRNKNHRNDVADHHNFIDPNRIYLDYKDDDIHTDTKTNYKSSQIINPDDSHKIVAHQVSGFNQQRSYVSKYLENKKSDRNKRKKKTKIYESNDEDDSTQIISNMENSARLADSLSQLKEYLLKQNYQNPKTFQKTSIHDYIQFIHGLQNSFKKNIE